MESDLSLEGYEPDAHVDDVVAFHIHIDGATQEIPYHQHRKGQLILVLRGGVFCEMGQGVWMVPPHHAVWIPGLQRHSNRVTSGAKICFLFIEPGVINMPEQCCSLRISPLVRELILRLAELTPARTEHVVSQKILALLQEELPAQKVAPLRLPVSEHAKIRQMVDFISTYPEARRTLTAWADKLAMSERSLSRLVQRETGLSFRRWRQQLQVILALRFLIEGKNVQQVARALGYESTTAFITMFRQVLGTTPGRYLSERPEECEVLFSDEQ